MAVSLHDRFKRLHRKLFGDGATDAVLAATISTLEAGGKLVELAPVPGLASVVDVLVGILNKARVRIVSFCAALMDDHRDDRLPDQTRRP